MRELLLFCIYFPWFGDFRDEIKLKLIENLIIERNKPLVRLACNVIKKRLQRSFCPVNF